MKNFVVLVLSLFFAFSSNAQGQGQKWLAEARKGNVKAMYQTAIRYHMGMDGLAKDEKKAQYWAEKAGNEGYVKAMMLAGQTYDDLETKKFDSRRIYWFKKAAETGDIEAMGRTRDTYSLLEAKLVSKKDKRKSIEQYLYWNDRMLESDLPDKKREECEWMKKIISEKLERLNQEPEQ